MNSLHPTTRAQQNRRRLLKALGVLVLLAALASAGYLGQRLLKLLGPPERCWELSEIEGQLYKINPCTGQFVLLGEVR